MMNADLLLLGHPAAPAAALWGAPRWVWLGGFGGATYVLLAIGVALIRWR